MHLRTFTFEIDYPVYGAKFVDESTLLVTGGYGESNEQVGNKITALKVNFRRKHKKLKKYRELVLPFCFNYPTCLDTNGEIILVGFNEEVFNEEEFADFPDFSNLRKYNWENEHLVFDKPVELFENIERTLSFAQLCYISDDGTVGAVASSYQKAPKIVVFNPVDLTVRYRITAADNQQISDMHISPDGKLLCYITDNTFEAISTVTGRSLLKNTDFGKNISSLNKIRFISNNDILIAASLKNNKGIVFILYSVSKLQVLKTQQISTKIKAVTSLDYCPVINPVTKKFDPDNSLIGFSGNDSSITILKYKKFKKVATYDKEQTFITKVTFSPTGEYLATVSSQNTVHIVKIPLEELVTSGNSNILASVFYSFFCLVFVGLIAVITQYLINKRVFNHLIEQIKKNRADSSSYFTMNEVQDEPIVTSSFIENTTPKPYTAPRSIVEEIVYDDIMSKSTVQLNQEAHTISKRDPITYTQPAQVTQVTEISDDMINIKESTIVQSLPQAVVSTPLSAKEVEASETVSSQTKEQLQKSSSLPKSSATPTSASSYTSSQVATSAVESASNNFSKVLQDTAIKVTVQEPTPQSSVHLDISEAIDELASEVAVEDKFHQSVETTGDGALYTSAETISISSSKTSELKTAELPTLQPEITRISAPEATRLTQAVVKQPVTKSKSSDPDLMSTTSSGTVAFEPVQNIKQRDQIDSYDHVSSEDKLQLVAETQLAESAVETRTLQLDNEKMVSKALSESPKAQTEATVLAESVAQYTTNSIIPVSSSSSIESSVASTSESAKNVASIETAKKQDDLPIYQPAELEQDAIEYGTMIDPKELTATTSSESFSTASSIPESQQEQQPKTSSLVYPTAIALSINTLKSGSVQVDSIVPTSAKPISVAEPSSSSSVTSVFSKETESSSLEAKPKAKTIVTSSYNEIPKATGQTISSVSLLSVEIPNVSSALVSKAVDVPSVISSASIATPSAEIEKELSSGPKEEIKIETQASETPAASSAIQNPDIVSTSELLTSIVEKISTAVSSASASASAFISSDTETTEPSSVHAATVEEIENPAGSSQDIFESESISTQVVNETAETSQPAKVVTSVPPAEPVFTAKPSISKLVSVSSVSKPKQASSSAITKSSMTEIVIEDIPISIEPSFSASSSSSSVAAVSTSVQPTRAKYSKKPSPSAQPASIASLESVVTASASTGAGVSESASELSSLESSRTAAKSTDRNDETVVAASESPSSSTPESSSASASASASIAAQSAAPIVEEEVEVTVHTLATPTDTETSTSEQAPSASSSSDSSSDSSSSLVKNYQSSSNIEAEEPIVNLPTTSPVTANTETEPETKTATNTIAEEASSTQDVIERDEL